MDALHSHIQGEGKWEISARSPTGFQTHTQVPPNEMYTDTHVCACMLSLQSCLTLCDPMDCSPQGSSVHGILQTRILEWVVIPFSRNFPDPGIKPRSPAMQADSLPQSHGQRTNHPKPDNLTLLIMLFPASCFLLYTSLLLSENT